MCGIVAMFSQHGSIASEALQNAIQSLGHRGPDGQRHWIAPDRRVALGHTRLSIIDLTTGDQPIANEDETLRIIVNGEFYGYEATQQELAEAGHRLRTRSDSEIALHLYEDLGAHCLHRLRGEFAIVLWDSVNRRLFAARDRFGIKPLFYAFHEGTLYLASEIKALLAAGVPRRWDSESVYDSGGFGGDQTRTLFASVKCVPPGHYLMASDADVQLKQYWDFDYPQAAFSAGRVRSDAEYAEEFRCALEEAIRLRLRADVPVGCYLSGGIDSCAVLGLAARHHRGPIRAFTLAFDRPEYNESEIAREMAAKAEAEFFPIPIRHDQLADEFSDAILQSETLCVNAHGVAKYLLSRAVRDAGYKVVLTGEGSDEILGGYLHFRRDMPANGQPAPAASLQRLPRFTPSTTPGNGNGHELDSVRQLLGFVPGWMEASSALSAKMRGLLAREFVEGFAGSDGCRSLLNDLDVPGQLAGRDPLHQSLYLWSKTRLPKYLLTLLGDRMEMAHSVEGRVPFLDHRLVEVARSQPVNQKIHGATQKYVLRQAVRNMVTDSVYRRPKHPFLSPPLMLSPKGRFSMLLQDMLRGSVLASMPFFDQKKVVSVLDGLETADESSRVANDQVLMMVLSACVLHDRLRLSA
jgi:asparagine synthase (glutamine-hydrolysing)